MNENLGALLPEVALVTAAVVGLLAGAWLPRTRQWLVRALTAVACLVGLAATAVTVMTGNAQVVFGRSFAVDSATDAGRITVLTGLLLVICISIEKVNGHRRETEFYVLLLLSSVGTLVMLGANDLLTLFAAYLLASIPAYALAGFFKDAMSTEAALKYYLMGGLLGVIMLSGITILFGVGRATNYGILHGTLGTAPRSAMALGVVAVFAGLLFKIGGVPAQFWVPDVTDGTPAPVAAFVTTLPKIGGVIATFRFCSQALPSSGIDWPLLVAILAAASMTLGNLAAFFQTSVKRLLAYSTISQVGYLLMAVVVAIRSDIAQKALLFYLAAYVVTNLGAFAVVAELPHAQALADYRGLLRRHPGLAAVLVVCLLGLVGTPPTAVFIGKLEVFSAAIDGGYTWLAALAVVNTVASLFYYLRWLEPALLRRAPEGRVDALVPAGRWSAIAAYTAGSGSLLLGLLSGVVLPFGAGPLLR